MMQVKFSDRDNQPVVSLEGLFTVKRMRWALPGGARDAELEFTGKDIRDHLEILLEGLRYGVDILDDLVRWSGMDLCNSIEVQLGAVAMEINLDSLCQPDRRPVC